MRWILPLAAVVLVAGCTSARPTAAPPAASAGIALDVTRGACGGPWRASGEVTFDIRNTDIVTTDVSLVDPATGGVYAHVEALAPNTARPMPVALGRHAYALRCFPEDAPMLTGPTETVAAGPAQGDPAVVPVDDVDLVPAVRAYRAAVAARLGTLATAVAALDAATTRGDRRAAEAAWLPAHLAYARLGAAYGTFGDAADAIDGRPDGHPGGVTDPDFTGFHRIEYGLWHGAAMATLAPFAHRLVRDVAGVRADFGAGQTDPNDLPLRAHEIMENALEFELTGTADLGSGTSLATASANLDGTRMVLDALAPVLAGRDPTWPAIAPKMAAARAAIDATRGPGGAWRAVATLPAGLRAAVDGAVGGLLETLADVAEVGEVRRTQ